MDAIDGGPPVDAVTDQGAAGWLWVPSDSSGENPATDDTRLSEQFRTIVRGQVGVTVRSFSVSDARFERPVTATLTAVEDDYLTWRATAPPRPFYPPSPADIEASGGPDCDDDDDDDDDDEGGCAQVH